MTLWERFELSGFARALSPFGIRIFVGFATALARAVSATFLPAAESLGTFTFDPWPVVRGAGATIACGCATFSLSMWLGALAVRFFLKRILNFGTRSMASDVTLDSESMATVSCVNACSFAAAPLLA